MIRLSAPRFMSTYAIIIIIIICFYISCVSFGPIVLIKGGSYTIFYCRRVRSVGPVTYCACVQPYNDIARSESAEHFHFSEDFRESLDAAGKTSVLV